MNKWLFSSLGLSLLGLLLIVFYIGQLARFSKIKLQSESMASVQQKNQSLFLPLISVSSAVEASQLSVEIPDRDPPPIPPPPDDLPATPHPGLAVLPIPEPQQQTFSYAESTRGQILRFGDVDVQLPEDTYMYGAVVSLQIPYVPGAKPEDYIQPPIAELRRAEKFTAFVEIKTGRMSFVGATKEERTETRMAFDFLVKALGEDKIVEGPK